MDDILLKKEEIMGQGNHVGDLELTRYSGSEGIYSIDFNTNKGYNISTLLCREINIKYLQYRDSLKEKDRYLYGCAVPQSISLELRVKAYEKFYVELKKMLMNYYNNN